RLCSRGAAGAGRGVGGRFHARPARAVVANLAIAAVVRAGNRCDLAARAARRGANGENRSEESSGGCEANRANRRQDLAGIEARPPYPCNASSGPAHWRPALPQRHRRNRKRDPIAITMAVVWDNKRHQPLAVPNENTPCAESSASSAEPKSRPLCMTA